MKHTYLLALLLISVSFANAQNDTLLWENFEAETIDYIINDFPTGAANLYPDYLNFDVDGINDGSGADRPGEWFLSFGFADVDSTNTVLASNSWLQGEADGAENWLILPRIHIQDDQAMLYWKSAPFQLPRYLDGYQVLVSTNSNIETDFTDTLAVFAEFDGNLTVDFDDTATYVFTEGIMHTEIEYDSTDVTRHGGVLQQWSASLSDYQGQDIFIAFRHRSDDDNLISIDDLLVLGTGSVGIDEVEAITELTLFPNPVFQNGSIQISYNLTSLSKVSFEVLTIDGRSILTESGHTQLAGQQQTTIDLKGLAGGTYLLKMVANGVTDTQRFVISQ
jgi:hypothetical protein